MQFLSTLQNVEWISMKRTILKSVSANRDEISKKIIRVSEFFLKESCLNLRA